MLELKVHRFIRPLKKKWLKIEKESQLYPYQTYLVQKIVAKRHAVNMIRKHYLPAYCEVKENGKTVLIAPLFQKRGKSYTSFVGLTGFNVYDFIYTQNTSPAKLKEYIEFLVKELGAEQLLLDDIPENSVFVRH